MKNLQSKISNQEYEEIVERAKKAGQTTSAYVRSYLFPKEDEKEIENAILF